MFLLLNTKSCTIEWYFTDFLANFLCESLSISYKGIGNENGLLWICLLDFINLMFFEITGELKIAQR